MPKCKRQQNRTPRKFSAFLDEDGKVGPSAAHSSLKGGFWRAAQRPTRLSGAAIGTAYNSYRMSVGIAIRKEAIVTHDVYIQHFKREGRLSFELKCSLCGIVYIVYCEPGVKEHSARGDFEKRIWNEHPRHSEVISIGGKAVA